MNKKVIENEEKDKSINIQTELDNIDYMLFQYLEAIHSMVKIIDELFEKRKKLIYSKNFKV